MKRSLAWPALLAAGALILGLVTARADTPARVETTDFWSLARPEQVCTMSATWVLGVNRDNQVVTHSHIDAIETDSGARVWQALHRGIGAEDVSFDQILVDAATLRPIMSRHTGPDPDVIVQFAADSAQRMREDGVAAETLPLPAPALPEGPGLEVAAQAMPWRNGLSVRATFFDRWRGDGAERVRSVVWSVLDRQTITTLFGSHEVFHTRLAPLDGAFEIEAFVTIERPHAIVRMIYHRGAGAPPLVSELREYAFSCPR